MARHSEPQFIIRHCKLSEQYGYDLAIRLFGREAVDSLPDLKTGPNKGKPKGFIHWKRSIGTGYSRAYGRPVIPGTLVRAWVGEFFGTCEGGDTVMRGMWCGRIQNLEGSSSVLTAEYRQQETQRQADHETDMAALHARIVARGDPCGVLS